MIALHIFSERFDHGFPERGDATIEDAAQALLSTAQAFVQPVLAALSQNGTVHMRAVADEFASGHAGDDSIATPLLNLMRFTSGTKQWAHIRYFAHLARAMGVLRFDDVSGNLDEISHPRLPNSALDSDGLGEDLHAVDTDGHAPPTTDEPPATESAGDR